MLGQVLKHQGGTLGLTDVCRLLQISSSCRLAVQQSRGKQHVEFDWTTVYEDSSSDYDSEDGGDHVMVDHWAQ